MYIDKIIIEIKVLIVKNGLYEELHYRHNVYCCNDFHNV